MIQQYTTWIQRILLVGGRVLEVLEGIISMEAAVAADIDEMDITTAQSIIHQVGSDQSRQNQGTEEAGIAITIQVLLEPRTITR